MALRFSYQKEYKSRFGWVYRPIAKVSFLVKGQDRWIATWMIADTGADQTILPFHFANDLGIDLEKDTIKDKTFGVGGSRGLYLLKVLYPVKLGSWELNIPLGILDSDEIPPLMGRLGFMEKFDTKFSKRRRLTFKQGWD